MSRNSPVALGLILGLIFITATFAYKGIASAADPAFCNKYASDANKAATQAKQLKCGFTGPRWAKDLGGHTAWCLFVDQSLAQSETDVRTKDLKDCTCHWYADQTMVQIALNIAKKCGFTGLRWLDDKQAHFERQDESGLRRHEERDQGPRQGVEGLLSGGPRAKSL